MTKYRDNSFGFSSLHILTKKLENGTWQATTTTRGQTEKVWTGPSEQDAAQSARTALHESFLKGEIQ